MKLPFMRVAATPMSVAAAYLSAVTTDLEKRLAQVSPGRARVALGSQYAGDFPTWAYVTLLHRSHRGHRQRVPRRLRWPYDWLYRI